MQIHMVLSATWTSAADAGQGKHRSHAPTQAGPPHPLFVIIPLGIIAFGGLMANELKRRDFLKAAALAAGPAVISARGASEKINVGWIGVGTRGDYGVQWLHDAAADDVQ